MYDDTLTAEGAENAPHLISEMTNDQYLDAISCPRIDSKTQGKKVTDSLGGLDASSRSDNELTDDTHDYDDDDDSAEEDVDAGVSRLTSEPSQSRRYQGHATLLKGAAEPDGETERSIEQVCRLISRVSADVAGDLERRLREEFKHNARYSFLDPQASLHPYFRWRLDRNRAGDGIPPEYDYGVNDGQERGDGR